jgi:hypothetical protein
VSVLGACGSPKLVADRRPFTAADGSDHHAVQRHSLGD